MRNTAYTAQKWTSRIKRLPPKHKAALNAHKGLAMIKAANVSRHEFNVLVSAYFRDAISQEAFLDQASKLGPYFANVAKHYAGAV